MSITGSPAALTRFSWETTQKTLESENLIRCEPVRSKRQAHRLRGAGLLLVLLVAALTIVACGGNSDAESHLNQGKAHLEDGSYEQAVDEFDAAIRLDPEYASRGVAKLVMGDGQGAEQDFRKARELGYDP